MTDSKTTGPRRLNVLDFLSARPCQQRPGIRNVRTGKIMTTCPECHGLMWAGVCARDQLAEALNHAAG